MTPVCVVTLGYIFDKVATAHDKIQEGGTGRLLGLGKGSSVSSLALYFLKRKSNSDFKSVTF